MLNMQNVKDIEIPEGDVRTIHDKDNRLIWGRLAYDTKYAGDTYQQTYSGKNLYNLTSTSTVHGVTGVGTTEYFTLNGTVSSGAERMIFNECTLPAGTYTATTYYDSGETTGSTPFILYKKNTWNAITPFWSMSFTTGGAGTSKSYTFTLSEETSVWFVVYEYENGIKFTNFKGRFQLESGSSPTSYEPYTGGIPAPNPDYPQDIQVVTGEQTINISDGVTSRDYTLDLTGKNLRPNYPVVGGSGTYRNDNTLYYWLEAGTYTVSYKYSGTSSTNRPMFYVKDSSYNQITTGSVFASGDRLSYNSSTAAWCKSSGQYTELTFTLLDAYYIQVVIQNSSAGSTLSDMQVEKGSQPTPYAPYYNYELCKIDDYQDYIYKSGEDWYVHKDIGKKVLNGTENWSSNHMTNNWSYSSLISDINPPASDELPDLVCNYFTPMSDMDQWSSIAGMPSVAVTTGRRVNLCAGDSTDKLNDFKTWLSTNNTILYYALAISTDTKITDATLIEQLDAIHEWLTRYGYSSTVTGNLPIIINQTNL